MASKTNQIPDLSEHKRKVFFERLSSQTTKDSLKEYLKAFEVELCVVPWKEGRGQGYGFVCFRKVSNVDSIMSKRPHRIDGALVELYRSVPDQGSLKEKKGIKYLIVSDFSKGSLTKSDLQEYFAGFGKIVEIKMNDNQDACCIEFDDYDSVDKVLLDRPHTIKKIEVSLMKGDRNGQWNSNPSIRSSPTTTAPMKSMLKQVKFNSEVSQLQAHDKIYCIHITKLAPTVDAERLSEKFGCNIRNILMNSCCNDRSSTIECWLKHIEDRRTAEDFVDRWDGAVILESRIDCVLEEDRFELCNKYRVGKCPKSDEDCDWDHIMCTADGKCPKDCYFGHKEGTKSGYVKELTSNEAYEIKITGFRRTPTKEALVSMLREKNCFVDDQQKNVGYIGHIRTMKYAQRLMAKWQNKEIDGQKLKCQIEVNIRGSLSKGVSRSGSVANLQARNNDSSRFDCLRSQSNNNSRNSSRNTSPSRENSDSDLRTADEPEHGHGVTAYKKSLVNINNQKISDEKRKSISRENLSSLDQLTSKNYRTTSRVRDRNDPKNYAVLIEYKPVAEEAYNTELTALKLLKDVNGIAQRIDLGDRFDMKERDAASKKSLWILTEEPIGYTLEDFVKNIHRGGFSILGAVQLVQILTKIVKEVHDKGVFHQSIEPENIFISWDEKQNSAEEATLTLVNFSEAHIVSEKDNRIVQKREEYWYQAPQLQDDKMKSTPTVDASSVCAVFLWLLTNTIPRHDESHLPHQNEKIMDRLSSKVAQAVREANSHNKISIAESQVKAYLFDTLNVAFDYPHHQPWTINDLQCRLESIRELLLPRDRQLNTTDAILDKLLSMSPSAASSTPKSSSSPSNIFARAADAFQQAKKEFVDTNKDYSWSDGVCIWLDSTLNERRHDDILIYERHERRQLITYSLILTSFASVSADGDCITLSIGSAVNGKMSRIPIGCYSKAQNFTGEFRKNFTAELNRLLISIAKERQAIQT